MKRFLFLVVLLLVGVLGLVTVADAETPTPTPTATPLPKFTGLHMSDSPAGPPVSQFSYGITTVYAVFDYTDAQDTEIRLKVFPPWAAGPNDWFFNRTYTYTGTGTASITVTYPSGVFPADPLPEQPYRTILYLSLIHI